MEFWWSFHVIYMEFLRASTPRFSSCQSLCFADAGTCKEPPWNLHGTSMETPSKLHSSKYKDGTEELSKKGNMLRLLLLEITSNLHQNSMESPWNLHESDHWNQQGKSAKNLHQNSMEPTSILMKMTTKAFQKQCLKLLALFCHK